MGRWYNRPTGRHRWAVQLNGGPYAGPCDLTAEHVAALVADPADTSIVSAQGVVYEFDRADYVKHILHYRHHTHQEPTMPTPDDAFTARVGQAAGDIIIEWLDTLYHPMGPFVAMDAHGFTRVNSCLGLFFAVASASGDELADLLIRHLEDDGLDDVVALVRSVRAAHRMAQEEGQNDA